MLMLHTETINSEIITYKQLILSFIFSKIRAYFYLQSQ